MKTSKKQLLRYCALPLAAILLAGASTNRTSVKRFTEPFTKDTYHPKDCSNDLTDYYQYTTAQIKVEDDISYAKNPAIHKDVMYAADTGDGHGCDPAFNSCDTLDIDGENSLRYRIHYPDSALHDYMVKPLPVFFLFHPGGFAECPGYDVELMNVIADEMSRRGWIVVVAEYRRGKLEDKKVYTSVQEALATCRGQQDGRGVIRTIIKKHIDDSTNGTWKYLINRDQVFIGGASAGGVMALSFAYYKNQGMMDAVNPHDPASLSMSNTAILGPQNVDYYAGGAGSQYWPKFAGVLNLWGGLPIPKSYDNYEDSFFKGGGVYANPPLITFGGVKDKVVDFLDDTKQDVKFSIAPDFPNQDYHSESSCLNSNTNYIVSGYVPPNILVKRCSSLNMYNVLKKLERYTEIYYDCNSGHGLGNNADYGIGTDNTVQVAKYIAQRTAIFFQTIMNNVAPVGFGITGRSVFRDCKNNRHSCSVASDADSCINDSAIFELCP